MGGLGRSSGSTGGRLGAGSKAQKSLAQMPRVKVVQSFPDVPRLTNNQQSISEQLRASAKAQEMAA